MTEPLRISNEDFFDLGTRVREAYDAGEREIVIAFEDHQTATGIMCGGAKIHVDGQDFPVNHDTVFGLCRDAGVPSGSLSAERIEGIPFGEPYCLGVRYYLSERD